MRSKGSAAATAAEQPTSSAMHDQSQSGPDRATPTSQSSFKSSQQWAVMRLTRQRKAAKVALPTSIGLLVLWTARCAVGSSGKLAPCYSGDSVGFGYGSRSSVVAQRPVVCRTQRPGQCEVRSWVFSGCRSHMPRDSLEASHVPTRTLGHATRHM